LLLSRATYSEMCTLSLHDALPIFQSDGIKGGEHAHVGHNGQVVFAVAVAVGGDVHHQADVEAGLVLDDGPGVLGNLAVEDVVGLDRKSTRLNSSHVSISYAVFCLK